MNLAKKYYVDENGDMIGYTKGHSFLLKRATIEEKESIPFHAKLKIVSVGWLNSGFYLTVQDENGKLFSINNAMFSDYIKNNNVYLEGDWTFYQQGTSYSIGLVPKLKGNDK